MGVSFSQPIKIFRTGHTIYGVTAIVIILIPGLVCTCQCQPDTPTYREDIGTCVDTIAECPVASFVTGKLSESIPFVFLPLPGQLVYPSAHVSIPQSVAVAEGPSICVVSRVDMMTDLGWRNINNITSLSLEFQQPFQLYREEEKTYLQVRNDQTQTSSPV